MDNREGCADIWNWDVVGSIKCYLHKVVEHRLSVDHHSKDKGFLEEAIKVS